MPSRLRGTRRREYDFFGMDSEYPDLHRRLSQFGPRTRPSGDYVQRDQNLDTSYEALLELTSLLGEGRPRGLSEQVIASLPGATYREWATPGETEERCPICLDDYTAEDAVLKVPACSHWFHRGCLEVCEYLANINSADVSVRSNG
ncbi:uncharacterized protein B0H18DRAFT_1007178 [Fomitopsis serialis]|uniref:uncharacterized protein n=1 Tax=Fomitopsis serialis TaxID=139415 RepID=UPI002007DCCB|nr:uncharacterized protein B0H18DRAFT_1007178 [Neoantrodia serialis]KAH9925969.1 hypothetical protein B0H18DRAFT_1007178 [Neoantrodia serialis]